MLDIFRKFSHSFIAKFLLVLIVISFIVVGGLSHFASRAGVVASVGDKNIFFNTFYKMYRRSIQIDGLTKIKPRQLRAAHYAEYVLYPMIVASAMQQEVKKLKVSASDTLMANLIEYDNNFQTSGHFDKKKFKDLLHSNGYSEATYIVLLKKQIDTERYKNSFLTLHPNLTNIATVLARARQQVRSGIAVTKSKNAITVKNPTKSVIKNYYNSFQKSFETSEKRDVTALLFDAKKAEKNISKKSIEAYYKKSIRQYFVPEKRSFYRVYGTKKTLEKLISVQKTGLSFLRSAQKILKKIPKDSLFKDAGKATLNPVLRKVVFDTKIHAVSPVQKGGFGSFVVYVINSTKPRTKSLAEVRKTIVSLLGKQRITSQVDKTDQDLALGIPLEKIAKNTSTHIRAIKKVSQNGGTGPVFGDKKFIKGIFSTPKGGHTQAIKLSDGQYVFARVDSIYPPRVPPYNRIKDVVRNKYIDSLKVATLKKQLQNFKTVRTEKDLEKVAKKLEFKVSKITKLSFKKKGSIKTIGDLLFGTQLHSTGTQYEDGKAYGVFVQRVILPKTVNTASIAPVVKTLDDLENRGILQTLSQYLQKNYPVSINQGMLSKVYE